MHGLTAGAGDLQRAFGATEVGAWVWDLGPGRLTLDETTMALLGIDPETYDERIETWLGMVHPDDMAWLTAEVDKAVSTLEPYDAEYRVRRPDGSIRWLRIRGRVEPDADGQPVPDAGHGVGHHRVTDGPGRRAAARCAI